MSLDLIMGSFSFLTNPDTFRNTVIMLLQSLVVTAFFEGLNSSDILLVWMMNLGMYLITNVALNIVEMEFF